MSEPEQPSGPGGSANGVSFIAHALGRCDEKHAKDRFVQNSVGLHHMSFRARNREDVDQVYAFLKPPVFAGG